MCRLGMRRKDVYRKDVCERHTLKYMVRTCLAHVQAGASYRQDTTRPLVGIGRTLKVFGRCAG